MSAHLETIADHCLAAREVAHESEEEFIRQLLDALLFAVGRRLAAAEQESLVPPALDRDDGMGILIRILNGRGRGEAH